MRLTKGTYIATTPEVSVQAVTIDGYLVPLSEVKVISIETDGFGRDLYTFEYQKEIKKNFLSSMI